MSHLFQVFMVIHREKLAIEDWITISLTYIFLLISLTCSSALSSASSDDSKMGIIGSL